MPSSEDEQPRCRARPRPCRQPAAAPASPKVLLIAGGVVVAVAVGDRPRRHPLGRRLVAPARRPSAPPIAPGRRRGAAHVQGHPAVGNTLGSPKAPVTMVEYVDLQCPYCRSSSPSVLPKLLTQLRPHRASSGSSSACSRSSAPTPCAAANAALAAGLQSKQFNFTELLYFNQGTENTGWLDQRMVVAAGASIPGFECRRCSTDAKSSQVSDAAKALDDEAKAAGVKLHPDDPRRQDRRPRRPSSR